MNKIKIIELLKSVEETLKRGNDGDYESLQAVEWGDYEFIAEQIILWHESEIALDRVERDKKIDDMMTIFKMNIDGSRFLLIEGIDELNKIAIEQDIKRFKDFIVHLKALKGYT